MTFPIIHSITDSNIHHQLLSFRKASLAVFEMELKRKCSSHTLHINHTAAIDSLLKTLYEWCLSHLDPGLAQCISLVAVGGYGRREMGPFSDIDLLILTDQKSPALVSFTDKFLYSLWDAGFDLTVATRSISDCRQLFHSDIRATTAMIDRRFLCGNPRLLADLDAEFGTLLADSRWKEEFVLEKRRELKTKHYRNGNSIFLLEPNIKEGMGGLRQFHTAWWIGHILGILTNFNDLFRVTNQNHYNQAVDFMWAIRDRLHMIKKARDDRLGMSDQILIAQQFELEAVSGIFPTERLMQRYYEAASLVHHVSRELIWNWIDSKKELAAERVPTDKAGIYRTEYYVGVESNARPNPLDIFSVAASHHLRLNIPTRQYIQSYMDQHPNLASEDSQKARNLFSCVSDIAEILPEMQTTGYLFVLLPEYSHLKFLVQHNAYHHYTIDTHLIHAVAELNKLMKGLYADEFPLLTKVASTIKSPLVLVLAVLCHDIGKGMGLDHQSHGVRLVSSIAARWMLGPEESGLLSFLIKSHEVMSKTAFSRDLADNMLTRRFAHSVGTLKKLDFLYILTFCDIKSVRADLWSGWKAGLLAELYIKSTRYIENDRYDNPSYETIYTEKRRKIISLIGSEKMIEKIDSWLAHMPERYLLSETIERIAGHIAMWQAINGQSLQVSFKNFPHYTECTVLAKNMTGLFSKITGILTCHSLNILEAQLYSGKEFVLDSIRVASAKGNTTALWEEISSQLINIVSGEQNLTDLLGKKKNRGRSVFKTFFPTQPSRIEIDNDSSAFYTIIDIYAPDRIGLLFDITQFLSDNKLDIDMAKISTLGKQIRDSFYVRFEDGSKITDREFLSQLKAKLITICEKR